MIVIRERGPVVKRVRVHVTRALADREMLSWESAEQNRLLRDHLPLRMP
jgi:RecA/RadA recombinase